MNTIMNTTRLHKWIIVLVLALGLAVTSTANATAVHTPMLQDLDANDFNIIDVNYLDVDGDVSVGGNLNIPGKGIFGNLDVDTLNLNGNVISDSTGTISFSNEDLTTDGDLSVITGVVTVTGPNGVDGYPATDAPDVLTVTAGDGGDDTSTTDNGADGGGIVLTAGSGGDGGTQVGAGGDGGAAGNITLTTGDGGDSFGGAGAVGGAITLTTGGGGDSDLDNGADGGAFTVTTGVGGETTDVDGGDGGDIELTTGAGGTSGSGGSYGDVILVKNGGKTAIGTTTVTNTPNKGLRVYAGVVVGSDSTNNLIDDSSNGGGSTTLYIGNSSINVTAPSDIRLKRDVAGTSHGLQDALGMRVIDFKFKKSFDNDDKTVHTGLIAQEVKKICPAAVSTRSDGFLQVDYDALVPVLLKSIQELEARIATLESVE